MNLDALNAISAWLQRELDADSVTTDANFRRDVFLLTANLGGGRAAREFEVSEEVLDDLSTEDILSDLTREQLCSRWRRDPTMRLEYGTRRAVPSFESIWIRCDGGSYR